VIEYEDPDVNGKYILRCRVHQNSRTTKDVFDYCTLHKHRPSELTSFVDSTGKTQERPTIASRIRIADNKETTRP